MKAITLWQPWASLWLSPRKVHETRNRPVGHRGLLAVHASKRFEKDLPTDLAQILRAEFGPTWFQDLPTGALIGVVEIIDSVPTEQLLAPGAIDRDDRICGNFAPGRFGWKRGAFMRLKTPIPYRGAQGFFFVPDELLKDAA